MPDCKSITLKIFTLIIITPILCGVMLICFGLSWDKYDYRYMNLKKEYDKIMSSPRPESRFLSPQEHDSFGLLNRFLIEDIQRWDEVRQNPEAIQKEMMLHLACSLAFFVAGIVSAFIFMRSLNKQISLMRKYALETPCKRLGFLLFLPFYAGILLLLGVMALYPIEFRRYELDTWLLIVLATAILALGLYLQVFSSVFNWIRHGSTHRDG